MNAPKEETDNIITSPDMPTEDPTKEWTDEDAAGFDKYCFLVKHCNAPHHHLRLS